MVMYTHLFGPRSGGLTVLVADKTIYPVWERTGAVGDVWVKAEVEIVTDSPFYVSAKYDDSHQFTAYFRQLLKNKYC